MATVKTIDEAIEEIGVGPFQRKLLWICGVGWAADAMEIVIAAFVIPLIIVDFGLTGGQASWISTAVFIGLGLGAWFWGSISDKVGRKLGFQLTVLIDSVFGFISALSPNYIFLLITRTLTGFGVGGTLPVDYSIFAEYLPNKDRGRYLVILESFWAVGTIVLAGLSWLIVAQLGETIQGALGIEAWRVLLAISAIPGAVIFLIRRYIPESPRYLLLEGREEEARAILHQVAEENGVDLELDRLTVQKRTAEAPMAALWKPRFFQTTIMLWIAWFTISLGYYGTLIWLPRIFTSEFGYDLGGAYGRTFLLALAQLPGYFSAAWLIEKIGRKLTLAIYLAGSGLFTLLFGLADGGTTVLVMAGLMSFFSLGAWGVLYAYTPELYPTEVRSTGMGAASSLARVGGGIAAPLGGALLAISLPAALSVFAAAFVVAGVTVFLMGRETKDVPLAETIIGDPVLEASGD